MKPYGDFRKLYKSLRRYDSQQIAVQRSEDLLEIEEIWHFYETLTVHELRILCAAIKKTEAQLGYIPFCFSTVPIVFIIFSSKLTHYIANSIPLLSVLIVGFVTLLVFLIFRHFRNKSYNALHLYIVESLLQVKSKEKNSEDEQSCPLVASPLL
ncbi:hypothetical protein ABE137_10740 [Brevibacillus laterosporus]|uniref:Uncharacterized protein n=1 Tax=Brevibacillus laterosporus TaxID=1465 RepID=A0A0F7BYA6_BRELA|nr:hypothetical protein [Brevibacillus halotolerans]AKF92564.1 hypothetical protein EX87_01865 [Brevibacillus laterosporus]GIO01243.1 hypothetical protein J5TS2_19110 [Brevibacillus halotolerans]